VPPQYPLAKSVGMTSSRDEIVDRLERLRTLRSAWGVLERSRDEDEVDEISETGLALSDHLSGIIRSHSDVSLEAVRSIDKLLKEFEHSIRHLATRIPLSELRASLPAYQESDRDGLLDLLDVMLGEDVQASKRVTDRIGAIDYLITLLCARSNAPPGAIGFDPATLTPRLQQLCESAEAAAAEDLTEIEAEFFSAANLENEFLGDENHQASIRKKKSELGLNYFVPRVLRATVTYNTALLSRVADEIVDDSLWGNLTKAAEDSQGPPSSVFSSEPLQRLGAAVRRRAEGIAAGSTREDRIAWALDFDYLDENESKALCSPTLATRDDPLGTAILIGLLSRSIAVLSIELQEAGLSPDEISEIWVEQLRDVFQEEINSNLSEDAYQVACALSDLKDKFLPISLVEHHSAESTGDPVASPDSAATDGPQSPFNQANQLMQDALELDHENPVNPRGRLGLANFPWQWLLQRLIVAALLTAAIAFFAIGSNREFDGLNHEQLEALSPYLLDGKRTGAGTGSSFVGTIDERWVSLPRLERDGVARQLVRRLREQGMHQVMIYDAENRIRVQAIGEQATQIR